MSRLAHILTPLAWRWHLRSLSYHSLQDLASHKLPPAHLQVLSEERAYRRDRPWMHSARPD